MPAIVSTDSISPDMNVIPVIASFDTAGDILPLYLAVDNEQYKILSVTPVPSLILSVFKCKVDVCGYIKHITLTFHAKERVWTIPKHAES